MAAAAIQHLGQRDRLVLGDLRERPSDDGALHKRSRGAIGRLAVRVQQTARTVWKLQDTSKHHRERRDGRGRDALIAACLVLLSLLWTWFVRSFE